jgi:hypothetical protein
MNLNRILIVSLVIIGTLQAVEAQGNRTMKSPDRVQSEQAIQQLKEGVLIIKLISDRKKIDVLKQQIKANPNDRKTQKELTRTIEHRNDFNQNLINGIKMEYSFSQVYYMYDYYASKLVQGVRTGIFLDDQLQPIDINLKDKSIFVLGEGKAGESGIQAFIVHSDNMKPLAKPFPYYFKRNDFFKVFFSIFDSKSSKYRNLGKMARDMNRSFENFYKSSL